MASIKFFLDRPLTTRATRAVFLRYKTVAPVAGTVSFFPDDPILVLSPRWDQKGQRIRGTSLEAQKLNDTLRVLYNKVTDAVKFLRGPELGAPEPTPQAVREYLGHGKRSTIIGRAGLLAPGNDKTTQAVALQDTPRTLPQILAYCQAARSHELRKSTLGEYTKTQRCLQRYQPAGNADWSLSRLSVSQLEHFRQWLVAGKESGGADVDNQTANSHLTVITTCVRYFRRQNTYHQQLITQQHLDVLLQRFKVHSKQRNSLDQQELLSFYQAPLHARMRATLFLVRDVYCLGWCTSLRQSDLFSLQRANLIYEHGQLHELDTTSFKVLKTTRLPLNSLAREIVTRWAGRTPHPGYGGSAEEWAKELRRLRWPEHQLFPVLESGSGRRRLLRDLWKQLGLFTEAVEVVRVSGGRQQRTVVPRYELLSLHTARHGFGNFMAASNVPIEDTSLLMGHTTIKTTSIYYHRPQQQAISRARAALEVFPGSPLPNPDDDVKTPTSD